MNRIAARRFLPLLAALVTVSAFSPCSAQSGQRKSQPSVQEPTFGEQLIGRILAKFSRPRIQLRLNFGNDTELNELKLSTEIPLTGDDLVIPLQAPSGDSQLDKLIPVVSLKSRGLTLKWTANTDAQGNVLSNSMVFVDKNGKRQPLVLTLRSQLTDLLDLRIDSISLTAEGIRADASDVVVNASCGLQQSLVDLTTGKVGFEDTDCVFKGKYHKEDGKFTYRFLYDSFQ